MSNGRSTASDCNRILFCCFLHASCIIFIFLKNRSSPQVHKYWYIHFPSPLLLILLIWTEQKSRYSIRSLHVFTIDIKMIHYVSPTFLICFFFSSILWIFHNFFWFIFWAAKKNYINFLYRNIRMNAVYHHIGWIDPYPNEARSLYMKFGERTVNVCIRARELDGNVIKCKMMWKHINIFKIFYYIKVEHAIVCYQCDFIMKKEKRKPQHQQHHRKPIIESS